MTGDDARDQTRDELAELLIENRSRGHQISAYLFDPKRMADAILASDWLAAYVATKQAEALSFAADEIRRAQEEVGFPANHDRGVNYSLTILDDLADRARAVREA